MAHFKFYSQIKNLGLNNRLLYLVGMMLFFFALVDGTLGYIVPLAITQAGFSDTVMGIIFGSSSAVGAIFDFILSKYLNNTHYRRLYFAMLAMCSLYAFVLWQAKGVWLFLLAMALWGIYFDLQNFGNFDFVGRKADTDIHTSHFGVLISFKAVGYLLAPLIAGLLIGATTIGTNPFIFSWIMLGIAFFFYFFIAVLGRKKDKTEIEPKVIEHTNIYREFFLWEKIGKILLPVLLLTVFLNIFDAFFWTIGPLVSESFVNIHPFNGLFLVAYEFPPLFIGWIIGSITQKVGKKKTAFWLFLVGCLIISYMPLFTNFFLLLAAIFIASCFVAMSWPSINGAYADYISESMRYEKEIEGVEDFSTNFGYVIGPMIAGFLADKAGSMHAFTLLGFAGVICSLLLLWITPRRIKVQVVN